MTTLLDYQGRPVSTQTLKRETAEGRVGKVRQPFDPEVASGLTPLRLRLMLQQARMGNHEGYLALANEMERRDAHYYSTLQTRKLSIFARDHNVEAASESAEDERIAEDVRGFVNTFEFKLAVLDILDGLGKGFSVNEIMWETSETQWQPVGFKWRNPRYFQFDNETAEELRLVNGQPNGEELAPFKYIEHRPKIISGLSLAGGLARIVAALHVFKGYALKSWMAFAEVFGMPIRIGKYDEGATPAQKEELSDAVRDIGHDAAAIIPKTMEIVFERANASGNAGADRFYSDLANWLNKETSKAVLGQTMTVEDGSSLAQANIHNEVRIDIRNADAWAFAATINRDLVRPYVDLNYGPRRYRSEYPRYTVDTEEPEDLKSLSEALIPFINVGLPVMQKTILEKFGLPEPEPDAELLQSLAPEVEEPPSDDDEEDPKLRAFKTWVETEAARNTNMRTFRKLLAERLAA